MNKKKIAFVGTGFISQICHLPFFHKHKKIDIVALCDTDLKTAKKVQKKYKISNVYYDYKMLIKNEKKLDAIVLVVPRHKTFEISKYILKKKINLFSEKPMALSEYNAKKLVEIADQNKVQYLIGHMKRHDESIGYLKKLFKKKDFNFLNLKNVYYESFAGDSFGKLKKLIIKNKKYKSHEISYDVMKNNIPYIKKETYLKFLNTHSHAINLLRYLFGEIKLKFKNLDNNGEGIIGFEKGNKLLILNTRKIYSNDWHEKMIINFKDYQISLNFPMPMMKNQPDRLRILNLKTYKTKIIKLKKLVF